MYKFCSGESLNMCNLKHPSLAGPVLTYAKEPERAYGACIICQRSIIQGASVPKKGVTACYVLNIADNMLCFASKKQCISVLDPKDKP